MKKILASVVVLSAAISASAFAAGKVEAGKALVEKYNCAACHGMEGRGNGPNAILSRTMVKSAPCADPMSNASVAEERRSFII